MSNLKLYFLVTATAISLALSGCSDSDGGGSEDGGKDKVGTTSGGTTSGSTTSGKTKPGKPKPKPATRCLDNNQPVKDCRVLGPSSFTLVPGTSVQINAIGFNSTCERDSSIKLNFTKADSFDADVVLASDTPLLGWLQANSD